MGCQGNAPIDPTASQSSLAVAGVSVVSHRSDANSRSENVVSNGSSAVASSLPVRRVGDERHRAGRGETGVGAGLRTARMHDREVERVEDVRRHDSFEPVACSIAACMSSSRRPWSTAGSSVASPVSIASASTRRLNARVGGQLLRALLGRQLGAQSGHLGVDRDRRHRRRVDVEVDRGGGRSRTRLRFDSAVRRRRSRPRSVPRTPITANRAEQRVQPRPVATVGAAIRCSSNGRAGAHHDEAAEQADLGAELGRPRRQQHRRHDADGGSEHDPGARDRWASCADR